MRAVKHIKQALAARKALVAVGLGAALFLALAANSLVAQVVIPPDPPAPLGSLKTVPIAEPSNLGEFVQDKSAAIKLGKALFWDVQVGGDGQTACATCHFKAGTDGRDKNTLNPGQGGVFTVGGPNHLLTASDFPFTKYVDARDPNSLRLSDANDITGAQGVTQSKFWNVVPGSAADNCTNTPSSVFHVGSVNVRQVTGRNTPTAINAVFNFRNFWDGRANNDFNGVNPFGQRDPDAGVWKSVDGSLKKVAVVIPLSSLASQAVGPPNNEVEMSCMGRIFTELGAKLLDPGITPLGMQEVHPSDSVLGPIAGSTATPGAPGLTVSYADLVKQAFKPEYWDSTTNVAMPQGVFPQMDANFSLFFGLAIQLYESTLVSDDSPFDQYMDGNPTALTPHQKEGLTVFQSTGMCIFCHSGPEFTNASVRNVTNERLERMILGDGGCGVYDNGFYNIGVRPTAEDLGVGGTDPFGNPLSETGMAMLGKFTQTTLMPALGIIPQCDTRANVNGAFKTPTLRNVELTGPYFHNGGKATLRQAVEFYVRGGDFRQENRAEMDPDYDLMKLNEANVVALVDFLMSLTDERVRWQQAPFDHPALCVPNGHVGDEVAVTETAPGSGIAADSMMCIPAVGAGGAAEPFGTFMGLDPFMGEDMPPAVVPGIAATGAIMATPFTLQAQATDDLGLDAVELSVEGGAYQPMSLNGATGLYEGLVDTPGIADGTVVTITVRATDNSGRAALSSVTVTVNNGGPLVTVGGPASSGALVAGQTHTLQVDAQDSGSGVTGVEWDIEMPGGLSVLAWRPMILNASTGLWEADVTTPPVLHAAEGSLVIAATDGSGKRREAGRPLAIAPNGQTVVVQSATGGQVTAMATIEALGKGGSDRIGLELVGSGLARGAAYRLFISGTVSMTLTMTADATGSGRVMADIDTTATDEFALQLTIAGPGFEAPADDKGGLG
ncbi:MAG: hypothetical protein HY681_08695 [Chloroflexi bacterium]|nr:hypothetical protein [Chloroflexota bacterium]